TKYSYPGLYTPSDFHTPCTVSNYQDAANVQDCELFGLPDLNTGLPSVRQKIAGYLIMLARLGVAGFRVDAAKHIQQVELDDILAIVNSTLTAEGQPIPYYFLEVSGGAGEALSPRDYFGEAYGYPSILSSYAFDCPAGNDMGPPSDANGNTNDVTCAASLETATVGQWVCEHRDLYIRSMVSFRRVVAGSDINHWWDDGANAIAFSRGDKGFVAINRETVPSDTTIAAGMPPGTYCDLLTGGLVAAACAGASVAVD